MYVLTIDGQAVTEAMTLKQLQEAFGKSVKQLESSGYRVVRVSS